MQKKFTLSEANEALNIIRPIMDDVQAIREKILASQPEAWPAIEKSAGNGGNKALSRMVDDFEKLDALVEKVGAEKIPYVCIATCVNMAGGQPISMANLKQLRAWCDKYGIMLVHDMTRVAENAYFIQQREEGYEDASIQQIVYELCSLTDAATMSSKKDAMVNIGGFLAMNDPKMYERACALVVVYEGLQKVKDGVTVKATVTDVKFSGLETD